ncbi:hypothetical protein N8913_04460 [Litoricola sp.]|nr:hypothetical protein [Litorivicinus sp.]
MTSRSILELSDLWYKKGYQSFYMKLHMHHIDEGNRPAATAAFEKKQAIESFLTTALRACNDSSFSNKKVQEMAFVRASTILNSLAQIKIWANENDLPFKHLIKE